MGKTWHAEIRVKGGTFDALVDTVLDELDDLSPVASVGAEGLHLSLTIEEPDPVNAAGLAVARTNRALIAAGVADWDLAYASLEEWGEFERGLDRPTYPPLVGIAEIAAMAGVSRQRASKLAQSPSFPKPHATLASGPVWFEPNVRAFVDGWDRKPGRPPRSQEVGATRAG